MTNPCIALTVQVFDATNSGIAGYLPWLNEAPNAWPAPVRYISLRDATGAVGPMPADWRFEVRAE